MRLQVRNALASVSDREVILLYVNRTEKLIYDIPGDQSFSFGYLYSRITGQSDRPVGVDSKLKLDSEDIQHDLRLLVEDLTEGISLSADEIIEPVYTVQTLVFICKFVKTISRWRNNGLVSRKIIIQGRKRVAFTRTVPFRNSSTGCNHFAQASKPYVIRSNAMTSIMLIRHIPSGSRQTV